MRTPPLSLPPSLPSPPPFLPRLRPFARGRRPGWGPRPGAGPGVAQWLAPAGWQAERAAAALVSSLARAGLGDGPVPPLAGGGARWRRRSVAMAAVMAALARPFRGPACLGRLLRRGAGGATCGPRGRGGPGARRGDGGSEVAGLLL